MSPVRLATSVVTFGLTAVALASTSMLGATSALADDTSQGQSILDPAGPQAQHLSDLWYITLIPALIVLVLVGGAIIYTAFRFRRTESNQLPKQVGGNNALEFTWTLIPALVLMILFAVSVGQMPFIRSSPKPDALRVKVIGQRFTWSFKYPGFKNPVFPIDAATGERYMIIPVNTVVNLDIESTDVIHSWSVPRLMGRIDAIPGQHNTAWIEGTQLGVFYGQCTELCGVGHADMSVQVRVVTQQEFDSWYLQQKKKGA